MWTSRFAVFVFCASSALAAYAPSTQAQAEGTPQFAFPVEPVAFANGAVTLSGGLLMPSARERRPGHFPAVVMIPGAGPATFDEPAFRVHANAFVRAGFAVLLFDKRGSGRSTGDLDTSDYDDLAADVAAAVRVLRARPEVAPGKVGLLGRSEGGWVGTQAAGRDPAIAFVIMSSGSAIAPLGQTLFYTRNALRAHGATADEANRGAEAKSALWSYYRDVATNRSWGISDEGLAARAIVEGRLESFERFAPEIPQRVEDPRERQPAFFQAFTRKIYFEPEAAFRALRTPLLEVIGANDDVVEPASTIAELERLRASGLDVTIRVLPNVDHTLLIKAAEGLRYPEDYPEFAARWARETVDRVRKSYPLREDESERLRSRVPGPRALR